MLMLALMTVIFTVADARIAIAAGLVAKIQILPLAMAGAVTALTVWCGVTLLLGRIYCSTVCPMGALQDIIARIPRLTRSARCNHPYHYAMPNNKLRYSLAITVLVCIIAGISVIPGILDPYSAYGRIVTRLLRPLITDDKGNILIASALATVIAVVTLFGVGIMAWRRGRLYCNTICPVGAALSVPARWSLLHFDIDTDLCINCRACERVCKSQCISVNDHVVDHSRCVVCFDCVNACGENAIRYTTRRKRLSTPMLQRIVPLDTAPGAGSTLPAVKDNAVKETCRKETSSPPVRIDRRQFLATGLLVAAAPALSVIADTAAKSAVPDGMTAMKPLHPVAPPGRHSMASYLDRCTGCGLCVAHCQGKVLTPSAGQLGWVHALHPVMDYDKGRCVYDCTRCTDLCPTGALTPLTVDEKHIFIIGHARVEPANCIGCGNCVYDCPRNTISLIRRGPVPDGYMGSRSHYVASVDTSECIGCGTCQYVCPVTPCKAIIVDGIV